MKMTKEQKIVLSTLSGEARTNMKKAFIDAVVNQVVAPAKKNNRD